MTVINAIASISATGGYTNPHVTVDLRSYGPFIGWPPAAPMDIGTAAAVAMTHVVAAAHPRAINGTPAHSYADDWYDRIHLIPAMIDLGNLLKTQTRTIQVWNAWRTQSVTLSSVSGGNSDGVTLTAPGPLPLTFAPLQMRDWSVTVSTDGPAIIDTVITWTFAGGAAPQVQITGKRLTVWFTPPDWSGGITESLMWLTDVQQAWHGAQDRTPLRAVPRREWEFSVIDGATSRQRLEDLLFAWRARVFALPVWADQSFLSAALPANSDTIALDTQHLDFAAGSTALLRGADGQHESVEVDTVTATGLTLARPTTLAWPAGTAIYPCREARLTDTPKLDRSSADVTRSHVRFRDVGASTWPGVAPSPTYRGYPVLLDHPDESDDMTASFDRVIDQMDNHVGAVTVHDRTGVAWPQQPYRWTLYGRAVRAAQRSLLYWLDGRVQPVWLPTFADDLTVTQAIASSATTMRVEQVGVSLFLQDVPARRHVRIELYDGTCYMRQVTAASDMGDGTEQLALDSSLGAEVDPAAIRQVSWMMLATQATDQVQIQHLTDSEGVAQCQTIFVGVPQEEPA